jgi:PPK2 family polyphosphate:nucleotide phosphotransferase
MSKHHRRLIRHCRVPPGTRVRLSRLDPVGTELARFVLPGDAPLRARAEALLEHSRMELATEQERLWASNTHSVLVILQGMDASGKDGTIKHVMSGVSPQGCEVHSFRAPSLEELSHNFLWRYSNRLPARGRIGLFNRSYYEEVLVVRVHPEMLGTRFLPAPDAGGRIWRERFEDINAFERHLVRNGTVVLKFFLNLSKEEQRARLLKRIDTREKRWKFSSADVEERVLWDDYMSAYENMLSATSTRYAPWYVIPADDKHIARASVAAILSGNIASLPLQLPLASRDDDRRLAQLRARLLRT